MQAKILLEKTGCPAPIFKDWLKKQVIVPLQPGGGPGVHAEYDDANLLALAIALRLKEAAVVVIKYAQAFQEFQGWLRSHSSLEWPQQVAVFAPDTVSMLLIGDWERMKVNIGFVVTLAPICDEISALRPGNQFRQIPLLALEAVPRR